MLGKLLRWFHSNMEFRIREEKRGKYVLYYPQVKGGLLGMLGVCGVTLIYPHSIAIDMQYAQRVTS